MGLSIEQKVASINDQIKAAAQDVQAFIRNKEFPLERRWALYVEAKPVLLSLNRGWIQYFQVLEKAIKSFSWYDDYYIERYQTVDNVDIIEALEEDIDHYEECDGEAGDAEEPKLSREQVEELKEEMLQSGIRFWKMDW